MNRRDFLDPRSLAQTAGSLVQALDLPLPADAPAPLPDDIALLHLARRAMATTFELILPFGTPEPLAAGDLVFDLIEALEAQLTVYRNSSELCRLNRLAPQVAVPVEPQLFDLLARSAALTEATEGAFDISAGALIKAWGFFKGPARVPSLLERETALQRTGMKHVLLDPERRSVRYQRPGLELNLGSIGKGYALDRAAALLQTERPEISSALLQGGRSSVYARGCQPGEPRGWPIGLRHPWQPERRFGMVYLRDQALGTSAGTHRHLEFQGRKLSHLLDPRRGWPAEGMASVSVVAPTAAEADALATAFYIQGVDWTLRYCAAHPEVGVILLPEGEGATPVVSGFAPGTLELPADALPQAERA